MCAAVQSRLVADVPLGAFLSGGVDSTLIVALMAEREPEAVKTYTIGFDQAEFDESEHAARIASHLGVQHTVRVLQGRDVLDQLPDLVRYFDEPMADYSVLPTLAVSKLAREHVTVALTGDGADRIWEATSTISHRSGWHPTWTTCPPRTGCACEACAADSKRWRPTNRDSFRQPRRRALLRARRVLPRRHRRRGESIAW